MEGNDNNRIKTFNCFGNPESIGLRRKRWLSGFELFADGKGLIVAQIMRQLNRENERYCCI